MSNIPYRCPNCGQNGELNDLQVSPAYAVCGACGHYFEKPSIPWPKEDGYTLPDSPVFFGVTCNCGVRYMAEFGTSNRICCGHCGNIIKIDCQFDIFPDIGEGFLVLPINNVEFPFNVTRDLSIHCLKEESGTENYYIGLDHNHISKYAAEYNLKLTKYDYRRLKQQGKEEPLPQNDSTFPLTFPPSEVDIGQRINRLLNEKSEQGSSSVLSEAKSELDGLIGLPGLKAEVGRLASLLNIRSERRKHGLRESSQTLHFVFRGNPGTGKTTVARIIGKLLYGFGFLKTTKFVECGRSDLVGGYLGQTAIKVDEKVNEALDGVLFVDEAYTLSRDSHDSYGQEAVETLLKRMEDYRDRLTVIVAGYPRLMDKFMEANPGLQSRFSKFVTFEDYTANELLKIFSKFCSDDQYEPDADCLVAATSLLEFAYSERDESFGNARFVRNLFEEALTQQSERLANASVGSLRRTQLTRLAASDLPFKNTLLEVGKKRGFIAMTHLNLLFSSKTTDDQIRQVLGLLERNNIKIASDEEAGLYNKRPVFGSEAQS